MGKGRKTMQDILVVLSQEKFQQEMLASREDGKRLGRAEMLYIFEQILTGEVTLEALARNKFTDTEWVRFTQLVSKGRAA